MRIYLIEDEDIRYYADLIPEEYQTCLEDPKTIVVGATEPADDKKHEVAVGVMLLRKKDGSCLDILWIMVHPDYREREIGTELLASVFEYAKRSNLEKVCAGIPMEEDIDGFFDIRGDFFLKRGFLWRDGIEEKKISQSSNLGKIPIKYLEAGVDDFDNALAHMEGIISRTEEARIYDENYPTAFKLVELEYYGGEIVRL